MQNLDELIQTHGEPDILIDSFNKDEKRYAIWGYAESLYLNREGVYHDGKLVDEDFSNIFRNILKRWKKEQKNNQIATVGFLSYEFKDYIYNHIDFNKDKNNNFPLCWFCKPKKIIEYSLNSNYNNINDELCLEVLKDIIPLEKYKLKINEIKNYLKSGDVYQINFTDKKLLRSNANNSFELYSKLRLLAKPLEGIFIKNSDFDILSLSPESLVKVKNGKIETSPIKGTRPYSKDTKVNEEFKNQLQNSEKDKAEHLMIVDLLRNDLGKICKMNSIKVEELYHIKTFKTINHMVSKIIGKLNSNVDEFEIIKALFPGGSITGAPKESAMKIIDAIESKPRNIYTGSIGYIKPNGDMSFNISIRTLLNYKNQYEYGIGGGIVWDSDENDEWNEAQHKSKILSSLIK